MKKDNSRNKVDINIDLFDDSSCIVFVTLLKPLGYIKRVTRSVKKLFNMEIHVNILLLLL